MLDRRGQIKVVVAAVVVAAAVGALALATAHRRSRNTAGSAGNPLVLVLSTPYGDAATAAELGQALSQASGLAIEVRRPASRADAMLAIAMPGVDGGILPLFDYLLAHQRLGAQAALQLERAGGREAASVLLVREDSALTDAAGLAGQRVAFVDRASTTGYLLPAHFLAERKITVQPVFTGDHEASIGALGTGDVAAAGTYAHTRPGYRALAAAGSVPNEPLFFLPGLPRATRDKVTGAFVSLAARADGRALLARVSEITGLAPVDDGAYAQVTSLLAATQQQLADVVPGGAGLVRHLDDTRAPLRD